MQKSLDIFKAEPQSVFDVLCEPKQTGFYMPAYQRAYSWEEKHIKDLFSDCENVFRNLLESPDAIIFLGSILSVDDSAATTIYPVAKRHTPTHIKLVIDGQQRLSTLLLIIICLNERLNIKLPKLKKAIDNQEDEIATDALEDLREIVSQLIHDTSSFVIETQAEHALFKYYPKIIRSQVDCWGKDDKKASYSSPIAEALINYQRHLVNSQNSVIFKQPDLNSIAPSSERVKKNIKEIRDQLDNVQAGFTASSSDGDESEILTITDLVNKDTLNECLDFPVDEDLKKVADSHRDVQEIIFITAFSKFLLHRVCLTSVEVNNESYAFDMFEALNTTGEPLTAIETFVPKVIEHIRNTRKNGDDDTADEAVEILKAITDRFESITKTKEKNDKTKALILAFVRAYQGKVKVSSLRDQRDAMLKSYDSCLAVDKDDYLKQLKKSADFIFDHWQAKAPNLDNLVSNTEKEQAIVCLNYLTDIKHDITQSLLIQFILQDEHYELLKTPDSSFLQALKAITGFSVLWRAMTGGADGIDGVYKRLHERDFEVSGVINKPYQLSGNTLSSTKFNVDQIKAFFRQELESKILTKASPKDTPEEQWLDVCSKQQMLTKPKNLKFLVLAGFHHLELEGDNFVPSTAKRNDFLTTSMWDLINDGDRIAKVYDRNLIDDHGWDDSLNAPEVFNKLGNILVDARKNIANEKKQSWLSVCQKMLQAQKNDSISDIDKLFISEGERSKEAERVASVLMLERKYTEITFATTWNEQVVEERTQLLLKNAWRNLYEWLA